MPPPSHIPPLHSLVLLATTPTTPRPTLTSLYSDLLLLAHNHPPTHSTISLPPGQHHAKALCESLHHRLQCSDQDTNLRTLHLIEYLVRHSPFLKYASTEPFFTALWRHAEPTYNRTFSLFPSGLKRVSAPVATRVKKLIRAWAEALMSYGRGDAVASFWTERYVGLGKSFHFPAPQGETPWVYAWAFEEGERGELGMPASFEALEEIVDLFERLMDGGDREVVVDVLARCDAIWMHFDEWAVVLKGGGRKEEVKERLGRALMRWRGEREERSGATAVVERDLF